VFSDGLAKRWTDKEFSTVNQSHVRISKLEEEGRQHGTAGSGVEICTRLRL